MGGRGASSGFSYDKNGNPKNKYGTQYHTVYQDGNIRFVQKNDRGSETLMETMTRGRVYVTVGTDDTTGKEELISIVYFDNQNKRVKEINLNHPHEGMRPHVHHGYFHAENDGPKGATRLTAKERKMIDHVKSLWDNYIKSRT